MAESDVRGQVRSRYARAAEAVTAIGGHNGLQMVDADQCCAPASTTSAPAGERADDVRASNSSCCGASEVFDVVAEDHLTPADRTCCGQAGHAAGNSGCQ